MTAPLIPDAKRAAAQIEHALALNPTPGPWTTISRATYHWEEEADLLDADGNDIESAEFVKPPGDVPTTRGQMYMRDAVYITKVSPDKLRLLLDERHVLIDMVAKLRASEAARRELLARQVPDGWALVPVKPTEAMIDAYCEWDGRPALLALNKERFPLIPNPGVSAGQAFQSKWAAVLATVPPLTDNSAFSKPDRAD